MICLRQKTRVLDARVTTQCEYVNMADDNNSYELHESVFNGDIRRVSALIRTYDVAKKDKHGKDHGSSTYASPKYESGAMCRVPSCLFDIKQAIFLCFKSIKFIYY